MKVLTSSHAAATEGRMHACVHEVMHACVCVCACLGELVQSVPP